MFMIATCKNAKCVLNTQKIRCPNPFKGQVCQVFCIFHEKGWILQKVKAAAIPALPMTILPIWFGKPLAGIYVRFYQILAKRLEFKLNIVLSKNGFYLPKNKTFSAGYAKEVTYKFLY